MKKKNVLLVLGLMLLASFSVSAQDFVAKQLDCYKVVVQSEADFTLDGKADEPFWSDPKVVWNELTIPLGGGAVMPAASDYSVRFKAVYDADFLYLFFNINDDALVTWEGEAALYRADNLELFFNPSGVPDGVPNEDFPWNEHRDTQMRVNVGGVVNYGSGGGYGATLLDDIDNTFPYYEYIHAMTATGYDVEVQLPWALVIPEDYNDMIEEDQWIGFDVTAADSDEPDDRKSMVAWSTIDDQCYRRNGGYGFLNFKGLLDGSSIGEIFKNAGYKYANGVLELASQSSISIYTIAGQAISQQSGSTFDLSDLASGIYLVKVTDSKGSYTVKIAK